MSSDNNSGISRKGIFCFDPRVSDHINCFNHNECGIAGHYDRFQHSGRSGTDDHKLYSSSTGL